MSISVADLLVTIRGDASGGLSALSETQSSIERTSASATASLGRIDEAFTQLATTAEESTTALIERMTEAETRIGALASPLERDESAASATAEAFAALRAQMEAVAAATANATSAASQAAEAQLAAAQSAREFGASAQAAAADTERLSAGADETATQLHLLGVDTEAASAQISLLGTDAELAGAKISTMGMESESAGAKARSAGEGSAAFGIAAQMVAQYAVQAAASVLDMGIQFEASEAKLVALTGASQQQAEQLGQAALDVAAQTGQSAQKMGDGLYYLASAGFQGKSALTVMDVAAKAATGSQTDFKTVVDALTSSLRAYGAGAEQAQHYSDVLISTVTAGKMEMADLAKNVGKVAEVASASGISLEQVGASMAVMTQKGVSAASAAQGLRSEIQAFEKPTAGTRKELADLGLSVEDVRHAMQDNLAGALQMLYDRANGNIDVLERLVPNVRALNQFLGTAGDSAGAYTQALTTIEASNGATERSFQTMQATAKGSLDTLKAHIQVDLIEATQGIEHAIAPAAQATNDFLGLLDKVGANQGFTNAAGKAAQFVAVTTLLMNPVTASQLLIARFHGEIATLAGRFSDAVGEAQKFTDKLIPLEDKLRSLLGPLNDVKAAAADVLGEVGDIASSAVDFLTGSKDKGTRSSKQTIDEMRAYAKSQADNAALDHAAAAAAMASANEQLSAFYGSAATAQPTTGIDAVRTALQNASADADAAKTKLDSFLKTPSAEGDANAIAIAATTRELDGYKQKQAEVTQQLTALPPTLQQVADAQKAVDDLWNAGKTNAPEYAQALQRRATVVAAAQQTEGQAAVDNAAALQQQSDSLAHQTATMQANLSTLQAHGAALKSSVDELQQATDAYQRGNITAADYKRVIDQVSDGSKGLTTITGEQRQAAIDLISTTERQQNALAGVGTITSAAAQADREAKDASKDYATGLDTAGGSAADASTKIAGMGSTTQTAAGDIQTAVNSQINPALKSVGDVTPDLSGWASSLISQAVSAASTAAGQANAILAGVAGQAASVAQQVAALATPHGGGVAPAYQGIGESQGATDENGFVPSYEGVDSRQPPRAPIHSGGGSSIDQFPSLAAAALGGGNGPFGFSANGGMDTVAPGWLQPYLDGAKDANKSMSDTLGKGADELVRTASGASKAATSTADAAQHIAAAISASHSSGSASGGGGGGGGSFSSGLGSLYPTANPSMYLTTLPNGEQFLRSVPFGGAQSEVQMGYAAQALLDAAIAQQNAAAAQQQHTTVNVYLGDQSQPIATQTAAYFDRQIRMSNQGF